MDRTIRIDADGSPDVPVDAVGWRVFRLAGSGPGCLTAPHPAGTWLPRIAAVPRGPDPGGVTAVRDIADLRGQTGEVLGCVALGGPVTRTATGWEAACGYPAVLFTAPDIDDGRRRQLGELYGVPVHRMPLAVENLVRSADGTDLGRRAEAVRVEVFRTGRDGGGRSAEPLLAEAGRVAEAPADAGPEPGPWERRAAVALTAVMCVAAVVFLGLLGTSVVSSVLPDEVVVSSPRPGDPGPGACLAAPGAPAAEGSCGREHWGEVLGYRPVGPAGQARSAAAFECRWVLAARGLPEGPFAVTASVSDEPWWNPESGAPEHYATCVVHRAAPGELLPAGRTVDPDQDVHDEELSVLMTLSGPSPVSNAPVGACIGTHVRDLDPVEAPVVRCTQDNLVQVLGYPTLIHPTAAETVCDLLGDEAGARNTTYRWPESSSEDSGTYVTCLAWWTPATL